jgi:hypothetical protein
MSNKMISIRNNFSENPSGRYRTDGPNSGERFREEYLLPALQSNESVSVDLDSVFGFGSSFLEEAFGGLVRKGLKASQLHKKLDIKSSTASIYVRRAWSYIDEESERTRS